MVCHWIWRRKDKASYKFHTQTTSMYTKSSSCPLSWSFSTWAKTWDIHNEYSVQIHHIDKSLITDFRWLRYYPSKLYIECLGLLKDLQHRNQFLLLLLQILHTVSLTNCLSSTTFMVFNLYNPRTFLILYLSNNLFWLIVQQNQPFLYSPSCKHSYDCTCSSYNLLHWI